MIRLGGFIITYNRPEILRDTILKVFAQSLPPAFLWIIDNSEGLETEHLVATMGDSRIRIYRMGYNAGPAGGAAVGLKLCELDGADWIYWGDDNDPPFREDCFERLLSIRDEHPFCGILGAVGQFFDRRRGVIKRVQTRLLERKSWLEVDSVAGNMCMLVSNQVVKAGVFPDKDLFFGFEELDFCLKASNRGYSMIVDCALFLEARAKWGRLDFQRPVYHRKHNLAREYYSLRNLLMIAKRHSIPSMKRTIMVKGIGKAFYGFRFGFLYGARNFGLIVLAFYHYYTEKSGHTISF
jgi:GT2 family glycosyltransferase